MNDETQIDLIDHYAGTTYRGTFRPVMEIEPECISGVTEIECDDDTLFVATILHHGTVFAYHDWQAGYPEEICAAPEDTGRWLHNATDRPAIWIAGRPTHFA